MSHPLPLVLAVDAGNSKTHVAVCDASGRLVGSAIGPGGSPQTLGLTAAVDQVSRLARQACGQDRGFAVAAFAMAGLDLPEEEAAFHDAVIASGLTGDAVVCNDTLALLRSGTAGDGVAVVAGAGTNCLGVKGGQEVRFHALGRLTGDWGGGNDIGADALGIACRAEDGRGPGTSLARYVPAHFGLVRPLELAEAVHLGRVPQERLVELSVPVFRAADEGDALAMGLVRRMADEVAAYVRACVTRLGCGLADLPVVLGGGILRAGNIALMDAIGDALRELSPDVDIVVPSDPPIAGALRLALAELPGDEAPLDLQLSRQLAVFSAGPTASALTASAG
ncbi:N-acetylglucosamine kinase [Streptomyces sp. NPDC057694]|uniref:N-acetylglucosamine kinase n=1 Tax=Streptomyces sp. NPDC057694 TaxID=3346216 RepID=UPI00367D5E99